LTLQYDKVVFLLEPNEITRELRRKRDTVVDYPDGRMAILPLSAFSRLWGLSWVSHFRSGSVVSPIAHRA